LFQDLGILTPISSTGVEMRIIGPILTVLTVIMACQKQSPITYKKTDGMIHFDHTAIKLSIDQNMRIKPTYFNGKRTQSMVTDQGTATDYLVINGKKVHDFSIDKAEYNVISNEFGDGQQLKLYGTTQVNDGKIEADIEKILTIELYKRFPNTAVTYVTYRNLADDLLIIDKVVGSSYTVDRKRLNPSKNSYEFSLFQGCGVDWGLDYAKINIDPDYTAANFIGITIAHRDPPGGGIPLSDIWSKEMGMAIAHISEKPEFVNLPVKTLVDGKVTFAIEESYTQDYTEIRLESGALFSTIKHIVVVHSLDYFDALRAYAEFLNLQGIKTFKDTPETVPQAYWKTWGYQMDFKLSDIYAKLAEFKEFGIEMIVLDDGWFSNYGDWEPSTEKNKFPEGRQSLIKFVEDMHMEGLKGRQGPS
jgi:alpha-galactosidase